jgi:hypothetical protein
MTRLRKKVALLLLMLIFIFPLAAFAENEDPPLPYNPPKLDITRVRLEPESPLPGETFRATFTVENHGFVDARNAVVEVTDQSNFEVMELSARRFNQVFTFDSPTWISFQLRQREGSTGNSITLAFSYDYNRSSGGQSITVNLPLPERSTMTRPNITLTRITTTPATPGPVEPFNASFFLDNLSAVEARNVSVELRGQENFTVQDYTNRKFTNEVVRGKPSPVVFRLRGLENRPGNQVQLLLSYTYPGKTDPVEQVINAYLPLDEARPVAAPLLKVASFTLSKTANRDEQLLRLVLQNLGEGKAQDVYLTFEGNDIYFIGRSNVDYLITVEAKGKIEREYLIGVNQVEGRAHYPLSLTLNYTDSRGIDYQGKEAIAIAPPSLETTAATGKPRVLISKYTLAPEKILAGNVVALTLDIENTHTRPVRNIKVSMGIVQVDGSAGGAAAGGTVFSPVNSSNSFFIRQIAAATVVSHRINLYVDPNATARTYIVPVTIEYEDEHGDAYRVEEMVNIPVTQESRMQIISVEVPPFAFMGQPAFVSAEFVNVGKVDLGNFIVMLEGDFHKEQAAYFVGNLQIGASDFYQGIIYPDQEGILEGELVFSYLDNNNQEVRVSEPFRMEVQGEQMRDPFPGEMPPNMHEPQGPSRDIKMASLYRSLWL